MAGGESRETFTQNSTRENVKTLPCPTPSSPPPRRRGGGDGVVLEEKEEEDTQEADDDVDVPVTPEDADDEDQVDDLA